MEKILFLDFDGVLHTTATYQTQAFHLAPALAQCLAPHECDVVISSSWRFQQDLDALRQRLPEGLARRVIGVTGAACRGPHARYKEIMNYLQEYGCIGAVSWRALDDSHWEFPPRCPELIVCNPNHGVQTPQLQELETWLKPS